MKFDIHVHSNLDPIEGKKAIHTVRHSPEQLFARAQKKGLTAIALTHHRDYIFSKKLENIAKKYGILLIPGVEAIVEGMDVIILNPTKKRYSTFAEIIKEKKENPDTFIFAPHPYYPASYCLLDNLEKHIDLFDGIEQSHFYFPGFNKYNVKAKSIAQKYNKQFIATGDIHDLFFVGQSYSEIRSNPQTAKDFVKAIKKEKIIRHSKPIFIVGIIRKILQHVILEEWNKLWHKSKKVNFITKQ